ncbi:fasciclin domain-containing protein [Ideonella sp. BN130291]|uniref:fasciclin domain-containing protein n=1 Tax=Ideonella sp. BN130291 TaxID=3112940 RepID=UPI003FA5C908
MAGCATTQAGPEKIADTAAHTAQLSTLNRLLNEAGMADTLRGDGPYTLFAPSDDAFKALPPATLQALQADKAKLKAVLGYHVVPGRMAAGDIRGGKAKTAEGSEITLATAGTFVTVEDAIVTQADVPATNGVVHVIDRVLMPPKK